MFMIITKDKFFEELVKYLGGSISKAKDTAGRRKTHLNKAKQFLQAPSQYILWVETQISNELKNRALPYSSGEYMCTLMNKYQVT